MVAALALAACGAEEPAAPAPLKTVRLEISGLSSPDTCPPQVVGMLESVAGVESATCDYESKIATVRVRGDVDPSALVEALREPYAATVAP